MTAAIIAIVIGAVFVSAGVLKAGDRHGDPVPAVVIIWLVTLCVVGLLASTEAGAF